MAIIKALKSSYGIDASYHKIDAICINYKQHKIILCISTYVSKESRINNYDPIDSIDVEVPEEDFFLFCKEESAIKSGYLWLKENVDGFEDSIDDLDNCSLLTGGDEDDIK